MSRWLVCVCLLAAGCGKKGPEVGRVSGQITYQDKAVPNASVSFVPTEAGGNAAMGLTDQAGNYELSTFDKKDGALVGSHKVSIVARAPFDGKIPEGMGEAYLEEMQSQGKPLIPERYFRIETSELNAEVTSGSNKLDFRLTDK